MQDYKIVNVCGHYEAYDKDGNFIVSGDTYLTEKPSMSCYYYPNNDSVTQSIRTCQVGKSFL